MDEPHAARDGPLTFLGRTLPPSFACLAVTLQPGGEHPYDEHEWRDALVVVERGEVELEALGGDRRSFGAGAVLWLVGQPLRALHNHGSEPAVLVAISRRGAAADEPP